MSLGESRKMDFNHGTGKQDLWQQRYTSLDHNQNAMSQNHQNVLGKIASVPDKGYSAPLAAMRQGSMGKLPVFEERLADRDFLVKTTFGQGEQMLARAQASLALAGYDLGDYGVKGVDGVAGPKSEKAIKEFQAALGLKPTGKVDQETMKALDLVTAKGMTKQEIEALLKEPAKAHDQKPIGDKPVHDLNPEAQKRIAERDNMIKPELKGDNVAKSQASLKMTGYDLGKAGVDGKLGPKTAEAIKEFQKEHGLKPTGQLDAETMKALEKATAEGWKREEDKKLVPKVEKHLELGDKGLVKIDLPGIGSTYFERQLVENLHEFIDRCKNELGVDIKFESVFRSKEYQQHLYDIFHYPDSHGGKRSPANIKEMDTHGLWGTNVVAKPDTAPHAMGSAFDLKNVNDLIAKGKFNDVIKIAKECGFKWQGWGDKVHFGNYDFESLGYRSKEEMVNYNNQIYEKSK